MVEYQDETVPAAHKVKRESWDAPYNDSEPVASEPEVEDDGDSVEDDDE